VLGLYLDNKVHSADDVQSHHEAVAALELGFCKPGLPCALDDELLIVCAVGGDCARDRSDKARSMYMANGGSEDGWRRVLALVDRIQAAVRGADVGMFVREK
jgi:hypothetical protein